MNYSVRNLFGYYSKLAGLGDRVDMPYGVHPAVLG